MAKRMLKSTHHYSRADQYLRKVLEDIKPDFKLKGLYKTKIKDGFINNNEHVIQSLIEEQCTNQFQSSP